MTGATPGGSDEEDEVWREDDADEDLANVASAIEELFGDQGFPDGAYSAVALGKPFPALPPEQVLLAHLIFISNILFVFPQFLALSSAYTFTPACAFFACILVGFRRIYCAVP